MPGESGSAGKFELEQIEKQTKYIFFINLISSYIFPNAVNIVDKVEKIKFFEFFFNQLNFLVMNMFIKSIDVIKQTKNIFYRAFILVKKSSISQKNFIS